MNNKVSRITVVAYCTLICAFVVSCVFFMFSKQIFNEKIELVTVEIGKEFSNNAKNVTIYEWRYDKKSKNVGILLEVNGIDVLEKDNVKLEFELRVLKEEGEKVNRVKPKVLSNESFYYLYFENINEFNYTSLTLYDNKIESFKFLNDIEKIEKNKVEDYTLKELKYFIAENKIKNINLKIKDLEIENKKYEENIIKIKEDINLISQEDKYKTEVELKESKSLISSYENRIKDYEDKINSNKEVIEEYNNRIENLEIKKEDIKKGNY